MIEYQGKYVTLMLCSECNNNCKHCYVKYRGRFSIEELDELLPKLNSKYNVLLNGTEPIMFHEYFRFFSAVKETRIITNGIELLKNPTTFDDLKKNNINSVWLSYHFGIQNEISNIKTDDLNRLIKMLKERDFDVQLMCSLSKENYMNIDQYCYEAIKLGANKIKFTNFINQGHAADNYDSVFLNKDQIHETLFKIDELRNKIDKKDFVIKRCGTFGANIRKSNFECLAGNNMAVITPDRKVYDCVFNISPENQIGYLDNENKIMINPDLISANTSYCKTLFKCNHIKN